MGYNIYNNLIKFSKYYNKKIILNFDNGDTIDFYFDKKTFAHLMGLHYLNGNQKKAFVKHDNIVKYKQSDSEILEELKIYNYIREKNFINRTRLIEPCLTNLENANLVKMNKSPNSEIKSIYVLLEIDNKHFLELGVGQTENDQYYLETFLVRNNDNNIDYSLNSKVLSIETYENDELKYFSFDTEKQAKLDEVAKIDKNYDYHEALNKSIEEIKNEKQIIDMLSNWKNRSYDDNWER